MKILTVLSYYRPHTSGLTIYAERLAEACVQAELKAGGTRLGGMAGTDEGGRLG